MVSPRLDAGPIRDYSSSPSLNPLSNPFVAPTPTPSYSFVINCSHGGKTDMGSMQAAVSSAVHGILPTPPAAADPTPQLPANDLRRKPHNPRPTSVSSAPKLPTAPTPHMVFAAPPVITATNDGEPFVATSVATKRRHRFYRSLIREAQQRPAAVADQSEFTMLTKMVELHDRCAALAWARASLAAFYGSRHVAHYAGCVPSSHPARTLPSAATSRQ
jgi:hypothetical protein